MLEKEGHPVLHITRLDDVIVVEHEHDLVRESVEIVQQTANDCFIRRLG